MNKFKTLILFTSLSMLSCGDIKRDNSKDNSEKSNWDKITLRTDFQSIYIYSDRDTIISNTWDLEDSLVKPGKIWHMRTNQKQEKIYLEPATKDTIHSIVMDMITKPVFTDQSVTCYAGNIRVCVTSD